MVFSTIIFLCAFLPITIIGYYLLPGRIKNIWLLLCSLFFYAWGEPKFVWIMLLSILCNYGFGMGIAALRAEGDRKGRKCLLILSVVLNLGLLFVFKYFTFAAETIKSLVGGQFDVVEIALPIGISFYTFQGLSYVIDVYRQEGRLDEAGNRISVVQRNPLNLALYIAMFPQLIAGPIVRYDDIRQSLEKREHTLAKFASGVERFIIGLGKKAILANTVGSLADAIMKSDVSSLGIGTAWVGAIAYTLQIYFDFSGYSDMAIGLGRIFGFEFMENFNYPYISRSIREFWHRWHISLSSWFRDYLYIPLGGNRRGNVYLHLAIVFLATGIWHGAAWGFLAWGIYHGFFILVERFLQGIDVKKKPAKSNLIRSIIKAVISWLYATIVVIVGWVIFAKVDLMEALQYIAVMFGIRQNQFVAYEPGYYLNHQMLFYTGIAVLACIPWKQMVSKWMGEKDSVIILTGKRILLLALLALSFVFIINSSYNPFIYFRF